MSEVSEKLSRRRSRTPCLDENRVEDESCADNSKEFELSDISDEDEQWPECNTEYTNGNSTSNANGSGDHRQQKKPPAEQPSKQESAFKKITRSNRDRNYRDNAKRRDLGENYSEHQTSRSGGGGGGGYSRKADNSRRKEIERYNVRKVVANRDFSISRSRSRSASPRRSKVQRHREHFSPKRDAYQRRSISPINSRQKARYSPISISPPNRNASISPGRYRSSNKYQYSRRSPSFGAEEEKLTEEVVRKRSRSRHKPKSIEKSLRRKKHKKSRSKSKRRSTSPSLSPEPLRNVNVAAAAAASASPSRHQRQIMNIANSNLPQENIKIILKNDEAFTKRQKMKKRDKKSKKEKISRKETKEKLLLLSSSTTHPISQKVSKEQQQQQKKEVFASGDNILISVCFNNNNNNNESSKSNNNTNSNNAAATTAADHSNSKSQKTVVEIPDERPPTSKTKSKKRRAASPAVEITAGGTVSSASDSFDKLERRQRKHKRKKSKRRHVQSKSSPRTPPMNPPPKQAAPTKRKSDMKPIAIIDLEKSPGKEITQSPKEVIVLSDSDGESKKRDTSSKDIVIIEDTILEKGISMRISSQSREHHSPTHATPESPPPAPQPPVLKFALKSKSNILPFNLLHDQAEETEETNSGANANVANEQQQQTNNKTITSSNSNNLQKDQQQQQQQQQQDIPSNALTDNDKTPNNENEAYDPFEPTKSGSNSPVTPPPAPSSSSQHYEPASHELMGKLSKLESLSEKLQGQGGLSKDSSQIPGLGSEDHHVAQSSTSSLWTKKLSQQQPVTPPLPPTFVFSSSTSSAAAAVGASKSHVSLYDGIYGSDLKTPVVPSPIKACKSAHTDKMRNSSSTNNNDDDDDDRTPYSPSSDGYDYEPPPQSASIHPSKSSFETLKHSDIDTQSSEPSGSYSFERNDEPTPKMSVTTPLKLTTSTLKSFNSSMRSSSSGLQFVNKAELSIFENYLPASQQKSPLVKRQSNSSFIRAKMSRFTSSMNENGSPHRSAPFSDGSSLKPPVIGKKSPPRKTDEEMHSYKRGYFLDDSILDDDVPSSAVDLVNKDKFLKKSLRIERVAEEVKLVLKPHYNKKHITKEEYKEILRKSVPKICHNKTGEINIQKITHLIEAYIKKVRYKRRAGVASSI